jgi:hypothetical protein
VLAWQWPSTQNGLLTAALMLPGNDGMIIAGIDKLVQRFLLELLTESGSILFAPTRGCQFMAYLRMGHIRTSFDAHQLFNSALVDITRNLLSDQLLSDPTDEQFAGATLTSISLSADILTFGVSVLSQAGTGRTVVLPLSTTLTGGPN